MRPAAPAAIVLLLVAVPVAQAEGLVVQAHDIVADLVPGEVGAPLQLDLGVQCSDVLPLAASSPKVVLTPTVDPSLVVSGELSVPVPVADCLQAPTSSLAWHHNLTLAAAADAAGLVQLDGTVAGAIARQGLGDLTGQTALRARAAFVGGLAVEAGVPEYNATLREGHVAIAVSNLGNAKTTAVLEVSGDGDALLQGPGDVVVERKTAADPGRTVAQFTFTPPDGKWTTATFDITVGGHAFGASVFKVAEPQHATVTFTNTAQPKKDSPGPGPLLAVGLLGLALALRRARA